jgi:hypothetical protein
MTRLFVLVVLAALSACFHSFGTRRMSRSSVKPTISMKSDPGKFNAVNAELSAHGTSRVHRVHPGVRLLLPRKVASKSCRVHSAVQRRTASYSATQCRAVRQYDV